MRLSGLLPLLGLCDGSFRRAERDETELVLLTPRHQREPRASRGCEVPARPSRNLALQCLDRHRSGSCGGVSLQMSIANAARPPVHVQTLWLAAGVFRRLGRRVLAGVTFHKCLFGGAYRACLATAHWRDHHICTQEDRPKNVPDCGTGLWFPVSFRDRWRGALSRPLTKQKARYCAGPFLLAHGFAFARPIAPHGVALVSSPVLFILFAVSGPPAQ